MISCLYNCTALDLFWYEHSAHSARRKYTHKTVSVFKLQLQWYTLLRPMVGFTFAFSSLCQPLMITFCSPLVTCLKLILYMLFDYSLSVKKAAQLKLAGNKKKERAWGLISCLYNCTALDLFWYEHSAHSARRKYTHKTVSVFKLQLQWYTLLRPMVGFTFAFSSLCQPLMITFCSPLVTCLKLILYMLFDYSLSVKKAAQLKLAGNKKRKSLRFDFLFIYLHSTWSVLIRTLCA